MARIVIFQVYLLLTLLILVFDSTDGKESQKEDNVEQAWQRYKLKFGKKYTPDVELKKRAIWLKNKQFVDNHNFLASWGLSSFRVGENKYSDLEDQEWNALMNDIKVEKEVDVNHVTYLNDMELPSSIDWRTTGCVDKVRQQGNCGSCWAFVATDILSTQHCLQGLDLKQLSIQQLLDCGDQTGNMGCIGGEMKAAFRYIKQNNGINMEQDYPYEAMVKACRYNGSQDSVSLTDYRAIPRNHERQQELAVALMGPIGVSINAGPLSFKLYESGILDEPNCGNDISAVNHGVVVVGFGEENGREYWLVKNSWGSEWGDKGYIKMSRNKNNQCGIASQSSYPYLGVLHPWLHNKLKRK